MFTWDELERKYNMKLKQPPLRLSGGLMHKMYKLETDQGIYALKLLNPFIMQRKDAMDNYREAERLESILEQKKIPILPALSVYGSKMQEMEGFYFYLFPYYRGTVLKNSEVTEEHCRKIGKILARIHGIDKKNGDGILPKMSIDWKFYLDRLKERNTLLYELLGEHYKRILESQERGNCARTKLPDVLAICHNDMDRKNVLWSGADYRIIDLECLAYQNPFLEVFEMALCWAGYEEGKVDLALFCAFLEGYFEQGGKIPVSWEVLYDCNNMRLQWLEYNLTRALLIDCGKNEQEIGEKQVMETIRQIDLYAEIKEEILKVCWKNF